MHVFISYAKKDAGSFATRLLNTLKELPNVTAWMDTSLEAADSWAYQIQAEIERCDYVVVLLSPDVNRPSTSTGGRSFVLKEISYAQSRQKIIIPVMVQTSSLPLQLADVQYINVTGDAEQDGVNRVVGDIQRRAGVQNPTDSQIAYQPQRRSILTEPRAIIIAAVITGLLGLGGIWLSGILNNKDDPHTQPITQTTDTPSPSDTSTDSPTATATLTPTFTLSPTPTHTSQPPNTFTFTPLLSDTPTDAPTATPSFTFTPSITPTPSDTAEPTYTPVYTVTPVRQYPCNGTIFGTASILRIVHTYPSSSSTIARHVRNGDAVQVIDEFLEGNRTKWYQIAGADQMPIGWITADYIHLSDNCPQ